MDEGGDRDPSGHVEPLAHITLLYKEPDDEPPVNEDVAREDLAREHVEDLATVQEQVCSDLPAGRLQQLVVVRQS
jgi:hypothetical protein